MPGDSTFTIRRSAINAALAPTVIAEPLLGYLRAEMAEPLATPTVYHTVVELNCNYPGGSAAARAAVIGQIGNVQPADDSLERDTGSLLYVYAALTAPQIFRLVELDIAAATLAGDKSKRAIYKVWDSTPIGPLCDSSVRTIKADAAQNAFAATGKGIVWAVMDSGIDCEHPHFSVHSNTVLTAPVEHQTFCGGNPMEDHFGHGTHVAGIIAGMAPATAENVPAYQIAEQSIGDGDHEYHLRPANDIHGMAPECRLLSLKVLGENGQGDTTSLLQAIEYVQKINNNGKLLLVHGVNISVGYPFDAQWYACGQTPLCKEIDRLVNSGVVVVVAAGNTGYVTSIVSANGGTTGTREAGQTLSINDPGNAELALTVGSTDRDQPHIYGISYYSSKGPTGDGRSKPDIVAPGEHIVSAAAGANAVRAQSADPTAENVAYVDDSGTSMAAPHVSGGIAAFLSVRREYIGRAAQVRDLVMMSATDLKRDKNLQGAGLIDVMRLLQSV